MTFLPLVERELRVVSRRKGTYWIRCGAALLSFMFLLPALALAELFGRKAGSGASVFNWMKWYGAITCVLAGAFLGADSIAEERREGSLGFLFLTDLKAHDVVLGKFLGASLNAFYGLLAMVPILGLSVLGGGVTGGEFWRTSLSLVNMLFFSTALAILISARAKSENRPTLLALALIVAIWLGGAAAFQFSTSERSTFAVRLLLWLSLASPGQAFSLSSAASYLYRHSDFWRSLAVSNTFGWIFIGLACWRLDASFDDQQKSAYRARKPRDRKLLERAPIAWLLDDSRILRISVWVLACAGALAALLFALKQKQARPFTGYALTPFYFLLKILFAICACRFFAEGRRSGALELLRSTPLGGQEMITEQWIALRLIFLYPLCLLFAAHLTGSIWRSSGSILDAGLVLLALYNVVSQTADFVAIGYGAMWIALACAKPNRAVWLTILLLVLIPTFSPLFCVPDLLVYAIFIPIARDKVKQHLNAFLAVRRDEPRYQRPMVRS